MTTKAKTARFWHWHNSSPVLIKIEAGQTLHHCMGGPTDEGYRSEANVWSFDGDVLVCEWGSDESDCDGRLVHDGEVWCDVSTIRSGYVDGDHAGVVYPKWEQGRRTQRDYTAEAAGY